MLSDLEKIEQINRLTFKKKLNNIGDNINITEFFISVLLMFISIIIIFSNKSDPPPPSFYTGCIIFLINIINIFSISCGSSAEEDPLNLIFCLILQFGSIIYLMYLIIYTACYEHLYFEHLFFTIVLFVKIQHCIFICVQIKYIDESMFMSTNYECRYSVILNQKPNKKQNTEYVNLINHNKTFLKNEIMFV